MSLWKVKVSFQDLYSHFIFDQSIFRSPFHQQLILNYKLLWFWWAEPGWSGPLVRTASSKQGTPNLIVSWWTVLCRLLKLEKCVWFTLYFHHSREEMEMSWDYRCQRWNIKHHSASGFQRQSLAWSSPSFENRFRFLNYIYLFMCVCACARACVEIGEQLRKVSSFLPLYGF